MKGCIVIIGSLLWDTKQDRLRWRKEDLTLKNKFQVYLPIRYGRSSSSRKNTHTMVFSTKCYSKNYGLGKGWVVPIVDEINSFADLKKQGRNLGIVEGFSDKISSDWGSVAIKFNPQKKTFGDLKKKWSKFMSNRLVGHKLLETKLKSERCAIDSNGLLNIRWPQPVGLDNDFVDDFDFLMATVIKPTLNNGRYPLVSKIADSMNKTGYLKYFLNNRINGIVTFQDQRILSKLNCHKVNNFCSNTEC